MKAVSHTIILALIFFAVSGMGRTALAQVPTLTITVTPSDVPVPLTIVRGTIVLFQGPISQQMTMTTFALRNDYGEFARGKFLDSWKLSWNTGLEHDPTEQIAVFWSRAGAPLARLTRYNVKFVEATPFTIKAETASGKTTVTISPTGTLTAQRYMVSLDGAPTTIVIESQGKGVIDTSLFRIGSHTIGATAVMADGSMSAIPPVPFVVSPPPTKPAPRKPVPAGTQRKPARPAKTHHP